MYDERLKLIFHEASQAHDSSTEGHHGKLELELLYEAPNIVFIFFLRPPLVAKIRVKVWTI